MHSRNHGNLFIDLHANGITPPPARGHEAEVISFSNPAITTDLLSRATHEFVQRGTNFFLPTLVSGTPEDTERCLRTIANTMDMNDPWTRRILGIHLEGPFFSPECRGAHPPECIVSKPDLGLFNKLFEAADGKIALATVSPALVGAPKFIEELCKLGVVVSIGHHNANTTQIEEAFDAGARGVTHAGNAWSREAPEGGRKNTEVLAQLTDDRVYVMVITDGIHVPPDFIKYLYKVVRDRMILVSDCSALAGAPVGAKWYLGDQVSEVMQDENGLIRPVPLSGSYLTLAECVEWLRNAQIVPEQAIAPAASTTPLQLVGPALRRIGTYPDLSAFS